MTLTSGTKRWVDLRMNKITDHYLTTVPVSTKIHPGFQESSCSENLNNKQIPQGIMSPALFLFELLKMSKLTRGPLVLYHLPKYWSRKKTEAKNLETNKKKKVKKKHNFKIPRAYVYPQTTSKMPVKFQKHLLKAVGGVVLTRYLLLYALS